MVCLCFFLVFVVCLCFYWCCFHGLLVLFLVFFCSLLVIFLIFLKGLLLLFLISFLWFARPFVGCHFLSKSWSLEFVMCQS